MGSSLRPPDLDPGRQGDSNPSRHARNPPRKLGADAHGKPERAAGATHLDFRAIRELPTPKVQSETAVERKGSLWQLSTKLTNNAASPALMVRVKAIREKSGDRILPAIYSDNYIALMPGESRTITTEVNEADTRGEKPAIIVGV